MSIVSIKYYCEYCNRQIRMNYGKVPCADCISTLRRTIKEEREYNRFEVWGQIWLVPKEKFSYAVALGEGKYVMHHMKRLAKKAATHWK